MASSEHSGWNGSERQRIAELEARIEELSLSLAESRAMVAPDGFSWLVGEGADVATRTLAFHEPEVPGLFSVIVPAYNAEAFLARSVASVWSQTLESQRIEIVIADDGSADGTVTLAQELARRSPVAMRLVSHPGGVNRGVAATRNLASCHARGEFLAFLDADDQFLPERLDASAASLGADGELHAVCSLGRNVDPSGATIPGYNGTGVAGEWRGLGDDLRPPFVFDMLWRVDPVANSSLTVRRRAFGQVGGFPDVMGHQAEDWLLVLKLSLLAPLPCIDRELFLYTHHPGAYTHAYHAGNLRDGARLEVFYHIVHWMLHMPDLAEQGRRFFRREFPRVVAAHHRLFPLMRDFALRRGSGAATLADFEEHAGRTMAELESLRRVVQSRVVEARRWRQEALDLRARLRAIDTGLSP